MTPEREKLIRGYWRVYRDQWHATIGNEFKVAVDPKDEHVMAKDACGHNVVPLRLASRPQILTFTRENAGGYLGHYRIVCEGIVVEME